MVVTGRPLCRGWTVGGIHVVSCIVIHSAALAVMATAAQNGQHAMNVRNFQGVHEVQEVTCSGEFLSPDSEVMMMSLYTVAEDKEVAFVNIVAGECTTYNSFSACLIDKNRSRKSQLKTLVLDLPRGGSRQYGCRLTVVKKGREVQIVSKSAVARRNRKPVALVACGVEIHT